eukprot:COSAG05_NODE_4024_length_1712_cov_25.190329_1_plen_60_part_00
MLTHLIVHGLIRFWRKTPDNSLNGNQYCHVKAPFIDATAAEISKWGSVAKGNIQMMCEF